MILGPGECELFFMLNKLHNHWWCVLTIPNAQDYIQKEFITGQNEREGYNCYQKCCVRKLWDQLLNIYNCYIHIQTASEFICIKSYGSHLAKHLSATHYPAEPGPWGAVHSSLEVPASISWSWFGKSVQNVSKSQMFSGSKPFTISATLWMPDPCPQRSRSATCMHDKSFLAACLCEQNEKRQCFCKGRSLSSCDKDSACPLNQGALNTYSRDSFQPSP